MATLIENVEPVQNENQNQNEKVDILSSVKEQYTEFLLTIFNHLEDESIKNSIEIFLENTDNVNFVELFVQNFLIHIQEILEFNIDFFATQKKYVYISKKGKKQKKRNPRRSYIFGNDDEQIFSNYLIKNNKIQYKTGMQYLQHLNSIVNLITFKENEKYAFYPEVLSIIEQQENNTKYTLITENIHSIMSSINDETSESSEEVEDVEDVEEDIGSDESDKEQTNKKHSNKKKNSEKTPFNVDFIKNSQIGKLAEDISKSINPEELNFENANPADIMKSLFSGNSESNEGIGKLVKHVFSEVEQRINSNSINEDSLANEAQQFLGSMGGLGGLGGLGNIAEIFGNNSDFDNGSSIPKTKKKSKSNNKK